MNTLTLDDELFRHAKVPHVNMKLHEEFSPLINEFLITTFCKKGYMIDIDAIESIVICEKMFKEYKTAMYDAAEKLKSLFDRNGILFRLYDLTFCVHTPHRIFCVWVIDGDEVATELTFTDQTKDNAIPFLYRLMHLDKFGNQVQGNFNPRDVNELDDSTVLPDWFITLLKKIQ